MRELLTTGPESPQEEGAWVWGSWVWLGVVRRAAGWGLGVVGMGLGRTEQRP